MPAKYMEKFRSYNTTSKGYLFSEWDLKPGFRKGLSTLLSPKDRHVLDLKNA
jgi:hypothetical protein